MINSLINFIQLHSRIYFKTLGVRRLFLENEYHFPLQVKFFLFFRLNDYYGSQYSTLIENPTQNVSHLKEILIIRFYTQKDLILTSNFT